MTRKLEAGITKIGETCITDKNGVLYQCEPGKYDFNILYGNILTPFINGEIFHLPPDIYVSRLYDYLNTDEGRQYEMPSKEEIRNASLEMIRREQALKSDLQKKAKENSEIQNEAIIQQEPVKDVKEEESEVKYDEPAPEPQNDVSAAFSGEQVYKFIQADRLNEQITDLNKDNNELKVIIHKNRITRRIIVFVLLLSMAVNGFLGYRYITGKLHGVNYAEMNISGIKYEVPVANVEVAEGQKKILIYGFTVTNENGQIRNVAVPLGEFVISE